MNDMHLNKEEQEAIISSFNRLNKDDFALHFYRCLFELEPLLKPMFKTDRTIIQKHFILIFTLAVDNTNNLPLIKDKMIELGRKHKTYDVKKSQFPLVKSALILTLQYLLRSTMTKKIEQAWGHYYDIMASYMIEGLES